MYEPPPDAEALVAGLAALGVNTVFAPEEVLNHPALISATAAAGMRRFLIYPVFYDPDALARDSSRWAILDDGSRAEDGWLSFVCPAHEAHRAEKVAHLTAALASEPDGLSIDFIRHFVYWEGVDPSTEPSTLPRSSYSDAALARFEADTGISVPTASAAEAASFIEQNAASEWTAWRIGLITTMAEQLATEARRLVPDILVNLHVVPWRQSDFAGAIQSVAGQDVPALGSLADFLSPMTYHQMVGQNPAWVGLVMADLAAQSATPILPSVEVGGASVSDADFTAALDAALAPPSAGVVFFNWPALQASNSKQQIVASRAR